jgi:hypothetical protein
MDVFSAKLCQNFGISGGRGLTPQTLSVRHWKLYIVATIYSFHPSLISTTLGNYLSRIMIDSLMMTF